MDWLQQIDMARFLLFTLILTRVSGVVMTAPIFGTSEVPMQVRALLAIAIALLVLPSQWDLNIPYPETTANYLVFVGSELVVGLCLGMGVVVLFTGLEVAGQAIAQVSGLAAAEIFDPTQETNVSVFSRLLLLVALAIFVCIGGHRLVMAGLLETFRTIPPGSTALPQTMTETLVTLVAQSFALGIRAAAPLVTAHAAGQPRNRPDRAHPAAAQRPRDRLRPQCPPDLRRSRSCWAPRSGSSSRKSNRPWIRSWKP